MDAPRVKHMQDPRIQHHLVKRMDGWMTPLSKKIGQTYTALAGPPSRKGVLNVVAIDEHIPTILQDQIQKSNILELSMQRTCCIHLNAKEIVPRFVNSRLNEGYERVGSQNPSPFRSVFEGRPDWLESRGYGH
jgi:hypothetical protein